jgi:hypothetical protein
MYVHMNRTTLVLDEAAMQGVRDLARREGRTMSELVSEFIRDGLLTRRAPERTPVELPAFDMGRPRVNLADRDALDRAMGGP